MNFETMDKIKITERVKAIKERLIDSTPQIESDRARLITESYKSTENLPVIKRRSAAFRHILENIPVSIREDELIAGSATLNYRSCQTFPEYSFEWLEDEFDTVEEFSIFSYSLLLEEYRTGRINFDCDGDNDKNGD